MHKPVLPEEVMTWLAPRDGQVFVDGTLGGGGHTRMLLERGATVIGLDRDEAALERMQVEQVRWQGKLMMVHGNFAEMNRLVAEQGYTAVDGILLDVGVSSFQIDERERGFSFQEDGPLDMRMDRSQELSAADLVNRLDEQELIRIFRAYGEEPQARRVAQAIVKQRTDKPFERTEQLAACVSAAKGGRKGRIHPATRVFQALRIEVNDELGSLEKGLIEGLDLLKIGGRMAVIAFHSLEDRRVKQFFNAHAGRNESLPQGGEQWIGQLPRVRKMTRKAVKAGTDEVAENPRSRSARLRVVERISDGE